MPKSIKYLLYSSLTVALAAAGVTHYNSRPQLVHVEPSEYAPVMVYEQGGVRCMSFTSIEDANQQTCMSIDEPGRLEFGYVQMMASALFLHPSPKSVLVIGLGGASLSNALHQVLPDARIDSVELDPAVVRVARRFFHYETGPKQRVFIDEGRSYVEKANTENKQYDVVMLDAFGEGYIPEHLLTLEFLRQVQGILAPDGIMVTNTFVSSPFYEKESATYLAAFGEFYNVREEQDGNRVIAAYMGEFAGMAELKHNAQLLSNRMESIGIDVHQALKRFTLVEYDVDPADVLRDPM